MTRAFESLPFLAAIGLLNALGPHEARAEGLTWSAPRTCPNAQDIREQVRRSLAMDLDSLPDRSFEAIVSRIEGGYELRLVVRRDGAVRERRIRSKSCQELVEALEATISLALRAPHSPTSRPLAATSPNDGASSSPSDGASSSPSDGASSSPSDGPPATAGPEPEPPEGAPSLISRDALAPASVHRSGGAAIHPFLGLGVLVDVGTLPEPAFGAAGGIGLRWNWFAGRAYAVVIPTQRFAIHGSEQVAFDVIAGGLGPCGSLRQSWLEFRGCIQGEVGRLAGEGVNVTNPRRNTSLWLTVVPEVAAVAHAPHQGWGGFFTLAAIIPFHRNDFLLTYEGPIHRPAPLSVRVALGMELGFDYP